MIKFEPIPRNDFNDFITTYYKECRKKMPHIEAIAGKWTFEDLIPGMSDFDTRFICSNKMTPSDWCAMSTAVGEVHLELCEKYPQWARNLEHLPGVNLTWDELVDDLSYYPESRQWSFYITTDKDQLEEAKKTLDERPWSERDEYFHLKKFLTYYGPYIRGIDPPINLGAFESKYPVHSRMMHYFIPPVQSAFSILLKRPIAGKMETVRLGKSLFPDLDVFTQIEQAVKCHYEVEELYEDRALMELEKRLFEALDRIKDALSDSLTLIPKHVGNDATKWKKIIADIPISPQLVVFDSSRFSRLMKGRLRFYANVPDHFDNVWLIQNELKRIGESFYKTPYRIYWQLVKGEKIEDVDSIVPTLTPHIISEKEAKATLEFSRLTPGTWPQGQEESIALKIADIFDDFFKGLCKIIEQIRNMPRNED